MFKTVMSMSLLLMAATAHAAVFGVDNRNEVALAPPDIQALASSTAVLVINSNRTIDLAKGTFDLDASPIGTTCSKERFAWDPSMDYACTGFLIAPDLLVTAGHCVYAVNTPSQERVHEIKDGCATFDWVFDYATSTTGATQLKDIPLNHLFHCKQIIYAKQTGHAPFVDYALIQLDRPAFGRTPFRLDAAPVTSTEPLALIGYDRGTPAKYRDQAHVTMDDPARDSFLTSLDAFEGDSGGPVFNSRHEVVGILEGGTPANDTYVDAALGCERTNRCNESGSSCLLPDTASFISQVEGYQGIGAEVQRIAPIIELLKQVSDANQKN